MKKGGQNVKALDERPSLTIWTADLYQAFRVLSESRPVYMGGLGPIPLTEIQAYCQLYEITDLDEVDHFVTMMRVLDSEYLKLTGERREREKASPAKVAGSTVPARPRGRMRR